MLTHNSFTGAQLDVNKYLAFQEIGNPRIFESGK